MQGLSQKTWSWIAVVGAAIVIYTVLVLVSDPDDFGTLASVGIFVPVVLLIIGLGVSGGLVGDQPYRIEQSVPLPQTTIEAHAVRWFAGAGWTLAASRAGALAFTRRVGPDFGPTLLLFPLGVLPGLLYLPLGGRTLTATPLTTPEPDGTRLEIVVNTRAGGGQAAAVRFFNSLHGLVDPASPAADSGLARPVP
jgi:hypothetical protein